LKLRCPTI